jgi:L-iditol 2-dehydrogenase
LLHLLYAVQAGVHATVIARGADRLDLAMRLGADEVLAAANVEDDPAERATSAARFAVVIECGGTAESWNTAVRLVAPGGRVLLFGGLPAGERVALDAGRIHYDELTLLGTFHFAPDDVREARDLLAGGAANVKSLVSGIEPLRSLPNVFERLDKRKGFKYALVPEPARVGWI